MIIIIKEFLYTMWREQYKMKLLIVRHLLLLLHHTLSRCVHFFLLLFLHFLYKKKKKIPCYGILVSLKAQWYLKNKNSPSFWWIKKNNYKSKIRADDKSLIFNIQYFFYGIGIKIKFKVIMVCFDRHISDIKTTLR